MRIVPGAESRHAHLCRTAEERASSRWALVAILSPEVLGGMDESIYNSVASESSLADAGWQAGFSGAAVRGRVRGFQGSSQLGPGQRGFCAVTLRTPARGTLPRPRPRPGLYSHAPLGLLSRPAWQSEKMRTSVLRVLLAQVIGKWMWLSSLSRAKGSSSAKATADLAPARPE